MLSFLIRRFVLKTTGGGGYLPREDVLGQHVGAVAGMGIDDEAGLAGGGGVPRGDGVEFRGRMSLNLSLVFIVATCISLPLVLINFG